ncbi:hypothetical protein [Methylobacterium sp. sgz302541]|uniref:hypothetical protein n=1 Tax=unclassified Methylobacterium TaxID=2615210 RepID=UPI003D331712
MAREMTEEEEHALDRAEAALDSLTDGWMAENTEMRVSITLIARMAPVPFRERVAAQVDQMVRLAYREGLYHGFCGHKDMAAGRTALAKDGEGRG